MRALTAQIVRRISGASRNDLPRMLSSASKNEFDSAVKLLSSLKDDPGNETKLRLYALYKQATIGSCNVPKPGLMDFAGKMKWEAWNSLQDMKQSDAQSEYVEIVQNLLKPDFQRETCENTSNDIISEIEGKIHKIIINRPARKNAFTVEMYGMMTNTLKEAIESNTTVAVVTGSGNFYSSGNDSTNFINVDPSDYEKQAKSGGEVLKRFVASFIDFPKPLLAVVNGPAIGIMATTLALFDGVYATDRATFHTPFASLAMTPEGCSSFTFPLIMGHVKACDLLLFNKKMTAYNAKNAGLVSEVFPSPYFHEEAWKKVKQLSELPPEGLRLSKGLIRENFRSTLHEVNNRECEMLVKRWLSQEFKETIIKAVQKKSRL